MALRYAERQVRLTKLIKRRYTTALREARLISRDGVSHSFTFAPGLSVLSGGNGAGKSTLLGSMYRCISEDDPERSSPIPGVSPWLKSISIDGLHAGTHCEASYDLVSGTRQSNFSASVHYIDAAAETEGILQRFRSDPQHGDLLEGVDPSSFSPDQLKTLSYILRREYSDVFVYEVTAFSEEETPVPFFEVRSMDQQYSLTKMGRGELAAVYLLWRLEELAPGSIVLIEEPESHLAVFSQEYLVDALIASAVERDLCLIVSSHSPGFFQKLPAGSVTLVSSLPAPSITSNLSTAQIAGHLGVRPQVAALVLVEDDVASEFAKAILSAVDREALSRLDIRSVATGESGVRRILHDVRGGSDSGLVVLGLLDGDQRPSVIPAPSRIGYLVGNGPPETVVREFFHRWRSGKFVDWTPFLPGGEDALRMTLEGLDGRDLHDWIYELAGEYGGLRPVMRVAVDLLLSDADTRRSCEELVAWLRSAGRFHD